MTDPLQRFFETSNDLCGIAGIDGYFRRINPAFGRLLGHPPSDLLSSPLLAFVHPEDCTTTLAHWRGLSAGSPPARFENRVRRFDGSYVRLTWSCSVPDPPDGMLYVVAREADGGSGPANERLAEIVPRLEHPDVFYDDVARAVARAKRQEVRIAVLCIELDGVAQVADAGGRHSHEAVLREIGLRIVGSIRSGDCATLLADNEFSLMLEGSRLDPVPVARRLIARVGAPLRGRSGSVHASIGIAVPESGPVDPDRLITQADSAMCRARKAGGNCFQYYGRTS